MHEADWNHQQLPKDSVAHTERACIAVSIMMCKGTPVLQPVPDTGWYVLISAAEMSPKAVNKGTRLPFAGKSTSNVLIRLAFAIWKQIRL